MSLPATDGESEEKGVNPEGVAVRLARGYDNTERSARSERNRIRILETLAELLQDKPAVEVTFDQIAARAGLSVRTVFRFYKDKDSLFRSFEEEVLRRLRDERSLVMEMAAPEFAAEQYRIFERNARWVEALRRTPIRSADRAQFRREGIEILSAKIRASFPLAMSEANERQIGFIAMLAGDALWSDLRRYIGRDGGEMADVLRMNVAHLMGVLEHTPFPT